MFTPGLTLRPRESLHDRPPHLFAHDGAAISAAPHRLQGIENGRTRLQPSIAARPPGGAS